MARARSIRRVAWLLAPAARPGRPRPARPGLHGLLLRGGAVVDVGVVQLEAVGAELTQAGLGVLPDRLGAQALSVLGAGVAGDKSPWLRQPRRRPGGGGHGPARHRDRRGRPVDAEHRAGRPDQPGGQARHVAGAAADVGHPHARLHPGPAQDLLGEVAEEAGLVDQAVEPVAVVAEDVAGLPPAEDRGLGRAIGCLPGLGERTPLGDGLVLPTRQTNRRRIAAEPGWRVSERSPGRQRFSICTSAGWPAGDRLRR
jgi:hypothetical protein